MELYFHDNFFSAGETQIMNASGASVGTINLQNMLTATMSVYDANGKLRCSGKFPFFSMRWEVTDGQGSVWGELRRRFTLFEKRYEYNTYSRGLFYIEAPAFSRSYDIFDHSGRKVAAFYNTNNWLQSGAFCLTNHDASLLDDYELIAVIMGVHSIQKRQRNAAN
ncbi:hypothetical protein EBB07_23080 [Paenibacillaceae bacterium]|nr:hypothetical protein EBB07_23080 [Paenibacillaceae bacterium]